MLTLLAHAKINLTLDVLAKRPDGYHEVEMVMQSISLSDKLSFIRTNNNDSIELSGDLIPQETVQNNLIYRAASAFLKYNGLTDGVKITVKKNIPIATGLAGGSTDAAATLHGLNILLKQNNSILELEQLALKLGSDVPFCLTGGLQLAQGRGEKLTPISPIPNCSLLIVKPPFSLSTPKIYQLYDSMPNQKKIKTQELIAQFSNDCKIETIFPYLLNKLEKPAFTIKPSLQIYKEMLLQAGAAHVMMSGSGPTLFAINKSLEDSITVKEKFLCALKATYKKTLHPQELSPEVFVTTVKPTSHGYDLINS